MDLSISSGSGTQTNTQSPQGRVSSGTGTAAGSNVQPGTATALLSNSSNGISLHPTQLSSVSISSASDPVTTSSSTAAVVSVQPKHHVSSGLLSISIGLAVIAVIAFLIITRSAKNTTNYK